MRKLLLMSLLLIVPFLTGTTLYAQTPTQADYLKKWNILPTTDKTNPDTIRLELNRLIMEHGMLTTLHLQSLYDGKAITRTRTLLDENANKIANIYVSLTNGSSDQFLPLWKQHIEQYERYTTAVKNKDTKTQLEAKSQLAAISGKLGSLFDFKNRIITADMIAKHMQEHISGTLAIIDAHALQNHDEEVTRIKQATEQAKDFADILAATLSNNR